MRVARVIAKLEPGGAQLMALRLTLATRPFGIETTVLAGHATRGGLRMYRDAGVEVEHWSREGSLQYRTSPGFARWLAARIGGADLVHAHMFGAWCAVARAAPAGVPLVATEHNDYQWPGSPPLGELRDALRRVDLFHVSAAGARAAVLAAGLPADRVAPSLTPMAATTAPARRGLPSPRVVFAGRLEREKGPDVLVEALGLMSRPPAAFMLGDGSLADALQGRAARLGLTGVVRFSGWRDDPVPWMAGASVCAVPSRHDSWSQTAVLAMALRVPVVAAAVEGLPRVCAGGRGILVPPDHPPALARAIADVLAGRRLPDPEAGAAYARGFEPHAIAARYASSYRGLIEERAAARRRAA